MDKGGLGRCSSWERPSYPGDQPGVSGSRGRRLAGPTDAGSAVLGDGSGPVGQPPSPRRWPARSTLRRRSQAAMFGPVPAASAAALARCPGPPSRRSRSTPGSPCGLSRASPWTPCAGARGLRFGLDGRHRRPARSPPRSTAARRGLVRRRALTPERRSRIERKNVVTPSASATDDHPKRGHQPGDDCGRTEDQSSHRPLPSPCCGRAYHRLGRAGARTSTGPPVSAGGQTSLNSPSTVSSASARRARPAAGAVARRPSRRRRCRRRSDAAGTGPAAW